MCIRDRSIPYTCNFSSWECKWTPQLSLIHIWGLTVNWEKSKFLQTEIHFLGFIVTPEGILANPDKVEAIIRFPEPKNIKQLQSLSLIHI